LALLLEPSGFSWQAGLLAALLGAGCGAYPRHPEPALEPPLEPARPGEVPVELREAFAFGAARIRLLTDRIEADPMVRAAYPTATDPDGRYLLRESSSWDAGFYPVILWLLYELTGETHWKTHAETRTLGLWEAAVTAGDPDLGFKMVAFADGLRLTGDPVYGQFLVKAAGYLAANFDRCVGAVRSQLHGNNQVRAEARYGPARYPVLVASLLNLQPLFLAAELPGGEPRWRAQVLEHAALMSRDFIRKDGSTYDLVDYPPDCPRRGYRVRGTYKGAASETTWARGQAFALHGFASTYRRTGDPALLEAAVRVADHYLAATTIPADAIPFWDLSFGPATAGQPRDTSGAALAAAGLLELAGARELGRGAADRYRQRALRILRSLARRELARDQPEGILDDATTDGHERRMEHSMIVGDFFFLDAIRRLTPHQGIVCAGDHCELEAESAHPRSPAFVVESDAVSTLRLAAPARSARAEYPFTLARPGAFRVIGVVASSAGSRDRVFLSFDRTPRAGDAWTIRPTDGLEPRTASIGQKGVRLGAGSHRLVLESHDDGVAFDKLFLERVGD
jgi:unsaturated chondroitin disaccharide hydrolase